ncbi:MAG: hypothetical protein MUO53_18230 [Maribacter sp.]|nr:hypothetical protein [Maribacter sp.]
MKHFNRMNQAWPILAISMVVFSQILILTVFENAKLLSIATIILFVLGIIWYAKVHFENRYKKDVGAAIDTTAFTNEILTGNDLGTLPVVVQKYMHYVGVVGRPKIHNVRITFEGNMREKGKDWFKFSSEQYNFFSAPARLFFMKAKVRGLPTAGYHAYKKGGASMLIKLLSLFPVVNIRGSELFRTETVTFFNDLCLFAPAALIDERIQWKEIDTNSVRATYTTNNISISAILYFNEKGQLVNFISNDRSSVSEMQAFPFSTPAKNYKNLNGYNLATYGEAIWHYPDGEFVYGKFQVKSIEYNVSSCA